MPTFVTSENWRDFAEDVDGAVAAVSRGFAPNEAQNLLAHFHFALENGNLFSECSGLSETDRTFLDYIELALARYVAGKSLDIAFGLKRGRGEKTREDTTSRDVAIAAAVEIAIRTERRQSPTREVKMTGVWHEVAEKFKLSDSRVGQLHADYAAAVTTLGDADLAALAGDAAKS